QRARRARSGRAWRMAARRQRAVGPEQTRRRGRSDRAFDLARVQRGPGVGLRKKSAAPHRLPERPAARAGAAYFRPLPSVAAGASSALNPLLQPALRCAAERVLGRDRRSALSRIRVAPRPTSNRSHYFGKSVKMTRSESIDRYQTYGLIAPAVLVLLGVAAYPIGSAIWLSLHRLILVFHEQSFVGLRNYIFLVRDDRFWSALAHTAYFTLVSVPVELLLGLLFALLLNSAMPARGLLRAAVLVPWAVPTVVSAKIWAWLLDPDFGPFAALPPGRVNWLGTPGYAMHAPIWVDVWKTPPFVSILLLAGLQTIPAHVYEAAWVDGASRWRTFRAITLPLLFPPMLVAALFRMLDAFRVFDSIYVLTQGGPANTTETISIYAYKTLMRAGDFGYGSALAVATFVCVMSISALYLKLVGGSLGARS